MIMKVPTNNAGGNGYYGHNTDSYEMDSDDLNEMSGEIDDDFSEYLWMENEEEFDKLEMQRLEEEALRENEYEFVIILLNNLLKNVLNNFFFKIG